MARWLIVAGCALVAAGVTLHFAPWLLNWFGRLPGDLRFESEKSRVYVPLASMLVISLLLTLLLNLFRR